MPPWSAWRRARRVACYGELRRISLLGTWVNSARTRGAHRRDVSHHIEGGTSLARQGIDDTMPFQTHQRKRSGGLAQNGNTSANGSIRVLLADDHTMFREGLAGILASYGGGMEVVA